MDPKGIDRILGKYEYKDSAVIAILQDVQEQENYLPETRSIIHKVTADVISRQMPEEERHWLTWC
jgi:NADH:ubiquinone oxidoreductase subunit E